ncbi:MAG TPA: four helix bundle protein [Candidatus Omnitrophota bacterium]|nr:four helix bundle protein [Candidatus Omnitrophota bacterium]
MRKERFIFEELDVWKKAVDFSIKSIEFTENINSERKHFRLIEQFESAATSVALNIAEGKGRFSKKEFIQFLYIARGSLYETVTLANIFYKKQWFTELQLENIECMAEEIGKMISGLINSIKKSIN